MKIILAVFLFFLISSAYALSHAHDFSWVRGQIKYENIEGGVWVLIYNPKPAAHDKYQGKFQLLLPANLAVKLKTGEKVVVTGAPDVTETVGIGMVANAYYKVKKIKVIQKAY